jgi:hypothetical protein
MKRRPFFERVHGAETKPQGPSLRSDSELVQLRRRNEDQARAILGLQQALGHAREEMADLKRNYQKALLTKFEAQDESRNIEVRTEARPTLRRRR